MQKTPIGKSELAEAFEKCSSASFEAGYDIASGLVEKWSQEAKEGEEANLELAKTLTLVAEQLLLHRGGAHEVFMQGLKFSDIFAAEEGSGDTQ